MCDYKQLDKPKGIQIYTLEDARKRLLKKISLKRFFEGFPGHV